MDILANKITANNVRNKLTRLQVAARRNACVYVDSLNKELFTLERDNVPFRFVVEAEKAYYTDNHYGEVVRGVVFQLPARKAELRFLCGIEWTGNGSITLSYSSVFDCPSNALQAARKWAERFAEQERDYSTQADAEQLIETLREELEAIREDIRGCIADIRIGATTARKYLCELLQRRQRRIKGIAELQKDYSMVLEWRM